MAGRNSDCVALIPAAGKGSRLGELPCSKELVPLVPGAGSPYVAAPGTRVAIEDTLHVLGENGIREAIIVITAEKQDIPAYLGDGTKAGVALTYVVRAPSPSVPHTLASAAPEVGNRTVVLVFPDILYRPRDAVSRLLYRHRESGADLTLALVPSDRGDKVDLVDTDATGRVSGIRAKPGAGQRGWTWIAAAWGQRFTACLAAQVAGYNRRAAREPYVGDIVNAACRDGLTVLTLHIPDGAALDIGTPEDLERLWRHGFRPHSGR